MIKKVYYPLIGLGLLFFFILWGSLFIIPEGKQAIVLQFGKYIRTIKTPGLKFKVPFIQNVIEMDARLLALELPPEEVIASDQKRLVVDTFLRYRIADPLKFYQAVRTENAAKSRLKAYLVASLSRILGRVPMATVLSPKRLEIMDQIQEGINEAANGLGIQVQDVRIIRTDLPKENSEAIYKRMNSERQREAQEIRSTGHEKAQKIESEANKQKAIIIATARKLAQEVKGAGEKKAATTYAALQKKDPQFFLFVRSLEAYKNAFGDDDTMYVIVPEGKNLDFFKYFNKPS